MSGFRFRVWKACSRELRVRELRTQSHEKESDDSQLIASLLTRDCDVEGSGVGFGRHALSASARR